MDNPYSSVSSVKPRRCQGHRRINNAVFLHLMAAPLAASEYKIILAVINESWGYNQKSAAIPKSRFIALTGLSEKMVRMTIRKLEKKQILVVGPSSRRNRGKPVNEYLFNKHYDTWLLHGEEKEEEQTGKKEEKRGNRFPEKGRSFSGEEDPSLYKKNIHIKEKKKRARDLPAEGDALFDRFWEAYPKKRARARAKQAWKKIRPDMALLNTMLKKISMEKNTLSWQKENGRYIPYPSTWLNSMQWEDETEGTVTKDASCDAPPSHTGQDRENLADFSSWLNGM